MGGTGVALIGVRHHHRLESITELVGRGGGLGDAVHPTKPNHIPITGHVDYGVDRPDRLVSTHFPVTDGDRHIVPAMPLPRELSRAVLKFARQALPFDQVTRPWFAVQGRG